MDPSHTIAIIGGGAAGIFAAALCAEMAPGTRIVVLEKTRQLLAKVRISGGGRCNVTHAQFDPRSLVKNYPRGHQELLGPFHQFQPKDTIAWFASHGVTLKTEEDGRMFPISDSSQTIIDCLLQTAKKHGVTILCEAAVRHITKTDSGFTLSLEGEKKINSDYLILATGSNPQGHALAASLGHTLIPSVPSLFTFNVPQSPLLDLSGISVQDVQVELPGTKYVQRGIVLLTHWGFSGPCILKLSAWAARFLHGCHYHTPLHINWIPGWKQEEALALLLSLKQKNPQKFLENESLFSLPGNLWRRLLLKGEIPPATPLAKLSNAQLQKGIKLLQSDTYEINGKTTFKQEFVTCGGVSLKEIHFKTMESKIIKHLYFAGEVLDIDGVTGGFNFQNAWTTAFLAASAITSKL